MWHTVDMSHMRYTVQLGERGRLVLPAPLRRELGLDEGAQLVLELDGATVRLIPARDVAHAGRGLLADDEPERSLVDELLAERRDEAEREAGAATAAH